MRLALAACLAACAGCGDNEPACGHVEILDANRNIWSGQIAVDDRFVFYTDYDNGIGTHLLFRQLREGGDRLVIGARGYDASLGYGMASDGRSVYWAADDRDIGSKLLATPVLGGSTNELAGISPCTARGIAFDEVNIYAGSLRCDDEPAHVIAAPRDGSTPTEIWTSLDADVSSLAAIGGDALVATTAGLYRVSPAATTVLDGRATYHVEIDGDRIVYSTDEQILAQPLAGGPPQTLYTFETPITQPRAFASDAGDLYISEPPRMIFVAAGGTPQALVRDMGSPVTHMTARDGAAYWSALAAPGALGLPGSFSGATSRVLGPCH